MISFFKKNSLFIVIILLFFCSRLIHLNLLPIFADEAIYIRWATMVFHDPRQYLFLPLYDGKTPLFIWLLIPFVKIFATDPLFGARLLSSFFGLGTLFAVRQIVRLLTGNSRVQLIASIMVILLPYPLFHDRMGLIDSAVTTWLGWCFYFYLLWRNTRSWKSIILAGVFWGLALMTKTTAFYFAPVLVVLFIIDLWRQTSLRNVRIVGQAAVGLCLGLVALGWMRITPLFPFLFQRSSDFAFSIKDILTKPGFIMAMNIPRVTKWLWIYLTPGTGLLFATYFSFIYKKRSSVVQLLACTLVFLMPFLLTGKLLASRYILPSILFLIPAAALALDALYQKSRFVGSGIGIVVLVFALRFAIPVWINPGLIPFSNDDVRQYLSDWSAGYGIPEVRDFLITRVNQGKRVLVGTEGSFGTLPDGLYVYFSEIPLLKSMKIIGVGQPIFNSPPDLLQQFSYYDETYLIVNKNRLSYDYSAQFELIATYQKPHDGAPLLLLKLKQ